MATIVSIQALTPVMTVHGGPPFSVEYKEAASQSFKKGAVVTLSAGKVQEATEPSSATKTLDLLGVAGSDATGTTDDAIRVYLFEGTVFEANISSGTLVEGNVGSQYGIKKSGGNWVVDTANTAVRVTAIAISGKDALGDTTGRLLVQFMSAQNAITD